MFSPNLYPQTTKIIGIVKGEEKGVQSNPTLLTLLTPA